MRFESYFADTIEAAIGQARREMMDTPLTLPARMRTNDLSRAPA